MTPAEHYAVAHEMYLEGCKLCVMGAFCCAAGLVLAVTVKENVALLLFALAISSSGILCDVVWRTKAWWSARRYWANRIDLVQP